MCEISIDITEISRGRLLFPLLSSRRPRYFPFLSSPFYACYAFPRRKHLLVSHHANFMEFHSGENPFNIDRGRAIHKSSQLDRETEPLRFPASIRDIYARKR